jgi:hypothetical protein
MFVKFFDYLELAQSHDVELFYARTSEAIFSCRVFSTSNFLHEQLQHSFMSSMSSDFATCLVNSNDTPRCIHFLNGDYLRCLLQQHRTCLLQNDGGRDSLR